MNERLRSLMVGHGALVFLVGMAAGFPFAFAILGRVVLWPFPGAIDWTGYVFVGFFALPLLIFNILPVLFGAYVAFTKWSIIGKPRWITAVLAGGGLAQLALGLPFVPATIVAAGLALGFVAQALKICVDTTLQEVVDDDYRGRVFSVYDTLFHVKYVLALLIGAFVLPASGISYPMLIAVGLGYTLTAVLYTRII